MLNSFKIQRRGITVNLTYFYIISELVKSLSAIKNISTRGYILNKVHPSDLLDRHFPNLITTPFLLMNLTVQPYFRGNEHCSTVWWWLP